MIQLAPGLLLFNRELLYSEYVVVQFYYIVFTSNLMLSHSYMRILLEVANLYNLIYQQWLTRKEQSLPI